jgi:SAM-dependent methyltransferase
MHRTAMQNGKRFFDTYLPHIKNPTVVDIGAQDVNGSLRQVCHDGAKYVGVDFVQGKGVDVVLTDPYKLPFESGTIDAVVSTSCFEHSEMFWVLFLEVLRTLKPDGLFYLNTPSNGPFHRYPVDCWRFYPDSGNALVKWARANGMNAAVLETFIADQRSERWNDCVCVFVKDEAHAKKFPDRMVTSMPGFTNGMTYGWSEGQDFLNPAGPAQDQRFLGWRIQKAFSRLFAGKI